MSSALWGGSGHWCVQNMPCKIEYCKSNYHPLGHFYFTLQFIILQQRLRFCKVPSFSLKHYLWMKYSYMFSVMNLILSWDFHEYSSWTAAIMLGVTGCEFYVLKCWELAQADKKWVRCNYITCERLSSKQWLKRNFSKSIQSFLLKRYVSLVILKRYLGIEDCLIFFFPLFTKAVMNKPQDYCSNAC